jgi:hypothetical protein
MTVIHKFICQNFINKSEQKSGSRPDQDGTNKSDSFDLVALTGMHKQMIGVHWWIRSEAH